jgi:hypothetical protein
VLSLHKDPRMGETTNIQRSEPSHSLFEVPAGYTVIEPGIRPFPPPAPPGSVDAQAPGGGNQRVTHRSVLSLVPLVDLLV